MMPPSIRPLLLPPAHRLLSRQIFQISPFLLPCLHTHNQFQQQRAASILSSLSDNPGAYNKRIRRGRGPSSGKGKTSGRGHKGQKQHGKVPFGFNGGQTKDEDTNPIRGLNNRTANFVVDMTPLNLDRVQTWINQGRIDPSRPITIKELGDSRCINPSNVGDGIKLLARGADKISHPLNIVVSRASKAAINAVESAGGSVLTRYYTPFSIRRIMHGKTDPINSLQSQPSTYAATVRMPNFTSSTGTAAAAAEGAAGAMEVEEPRSQSETAREEEQGEGEGITSAVGRDEKMVVWQNRLPDPVSRKAIEYYRDPAHRGYLSYQVGQGQGPSLFFKTPRARGELASASASASASDSTSTASETTLTKSSKKGQAAANRIW